MVTCSIFIISISMLGVSQGKYVPKMPTIFQSEEESEGPVHNHQEEYQWNHYSNYPPPPQYGQHESAQEESKSWSFFPAQSAEVEPLCDDMKRKMNALLHADTFSCERLPEDVAGTVRTFCIDSGSHTIHHCLTSDARDSEQGACLDRALEDLSVSPPLSSCLCQSMFSSFLSLFSHTYLLCSQSFLTGSGRTGRVGGAAVIPGLGIPVLAGLSGGSVDLHWDHANLEHNLGINVSVNPASAFIPQTLQSVLSVLAAGETALNSALSTKFTTPTTAAGATTASFQQKLASIETAFKDKFTTPTTVAGATTTNFMDKLKAIEEAFNNKFTTTTTTTVAGATTTNFLDKLRAIEEAFKNKFTTTTTTTVAGATTDKFGAIEEAFKNKFTTPTTVAGAPTTTDSLDQLMAIAEAFKNKFTTTTTAAPTTA